MEQISSIAKMRKIIRFKEVLASLNNMLELEARPPEVAPDFIYFPKYFLRGLVLESYLGGKNFFNNVR